MEYAELTDADQEQILRGHRRQFEAEHFTHRTNLDRLEALEAAGTADDAARAAAEAAREALATLDDAHANTTRKIEEVRARRAAAPAPAPAPAPGGPPAP